MTKTEMIDRLIAAVDAYNATGARDLPSVRKSVPRVFLNAVDDLVAAVDDVTGGAR